MPGVPSSKSCSACRAQKKKCDLQTPACSRCAKLGIPCLGAGVQRFKFVNHNDGGGHHKQYPSANTKARVSSKMLVRLPNNETTQLQQAFVERLGPIINFEPSTSWGWGTWLDDHYQRLGRIGHPEMALQRWSSAFSASADCPDNVLSNTSWAWGPFLQSIPQRLGRDQALDAAVATILSDHMDTCIGGLYTAPRDSTTKLNAMALGTLREALTNTTQSIRAETLCAVMLLAIVHARFEGPLSVLCSAHGRGALQLLRMLHHQQSQDEFDIGLRWRVGGAVLFQSLVNPHVQFNASDYEMLETAFENTPAVMDPRQANTALEHRVMRYTMELSKLQSSVRQAQQDRDKLNVLATQAYNLQQKLQNLMIEMRSRYYDSLADDNSSILSTSQSSQTDVSQTGLSYEHQRSYGTVHTVYAILLCTIQVLAPADTLIKLEATRMCRSALELYDEAKIKQPIGSIWSLTMLMPLWCAVQEEKLKSAIESVLTRDLGPGFAARAVGAPSAREQLDFMAERLRLRE